MLCSMMRIKAVGVLLTERIKSKYSHFVKKTLVQLLELSKENLHSVYCCLLTDAYTVRLQASFMKIKKIAMATHSVFNRFSVMSLGELNSSRF